MMPLKPFRFRATSMMWAPLRAALVQMASEGKPIREGRVDEGINGLWTKI